MAVIKLSTFRLFMMVSCALYVSFVVTTKAYAQETPVVFSKDEREHKKIAFLINEIKNSNALFLRNGKEYDATKASEHVTYKISKAKGRIKTARQFIHYIASRSFISGDPYYMKEKTGRKVTTREWLFRRLYDYEQKHDIFYRVPEHHQS